MSLPQVSYTLFGLAFNIYIYLFQELHAHLNGSLSEKTIQALSHLKDAQHLYDNWQVAINHGEHRTLSESVWHTCMQGQIGHKLRSTNHRLHPPGLRCFTAFL